MPVQPEDLLSYYNQGREQRRLTERHGRLELARTQELIQRYLQQPPATIVDVGGGAGIYALWLAKLGYTVHLVDLIPLHVEQAQAASDQQPETPLAGAKVGNALSLELPEASADAVLLQGPLYHLPEKSERLQALREALRILKPGGLLFAAVISRYASLMDGLMRGYLMDDHFAELAEQDVQDGQHRNPTRQPGYFTSAYFHYPTEIQAELIEAGFQVKGWFAIEGPAGFVPNFDQFWEDEHLRERLLKFIRTIESDPTIIGASAHIMAVGRKPE